jgi:hypothetical protein
MVIAENLPHDSTRNSLEKIFGIIGRSEQNTQPPLIPCSLLYAMYSSHDHESLNHVHYTTSLQCEKHQNLPSARTQLCKIIQVRRKHTSQ